MRAKPTGRAPRTLTELAGLQPQALDTYLIAKRAALKLASMLPVGNRMNSTELTCVEVEALFHQLPELAAFAARMAV